MALLLINVLAALLVVVGFHVAFRQSQVRELGARLTHKERQGIRRAEAVSVDEGGVASVLRMIGVMIMAFSFTSAAFANLIAYYRSLGAV